MSPIDLLWKPSMLHGMLDALPDADQQPQSTGEKPGLLMQQLKTLKKF